MPTVYIASHDAELAKLGRRIMNELGVICVASWIDRPFTRTSEKAEAKRTEDADWNLDEVAKADCLVLVGGDDKYPGGKFVEAGYALALEKPVVVVYKRENLLTWASGMVYKIDFETAGRYLQELFRKTV